MGIGISSCLDMYFTSDERETFLQSNACKPLADFICVHLLEIFCHLPGYVLGRRKCEDNSAVVCKRTRRRQDIKTKHD